MATKRDYALEYERRRIRAAGKGFSSPREEYQYNAAKKRSQAAGKKLTVYNFRQQKEAELKRQKIRNKRIKKTLTVSSLKAFGVSAARFQTMRKENRAFSRATKSPRLKYNLKLDAAVNDLSEQRLGYIIYYNQVFVHPQTKNKTGRNRENLVNKYFDLIQKYDLFADFQDLLPYAYARESKAAA